jgi:hypothetical protein
MRYTIRKKGEKYFKKFKPCGADLAAGLIVALTIIYTVFEVIRG